MIETTRFGLDTQGDGQVIDISDEVCRRVASSGIAEGIVTVYVTGTTAGIAVIEYEPGLVLDLAAAMERLYPRGMEYQHNVLNNDDNGHSHTRATMVGPSVVVPVKGRKPLTGTWQRFVLIDFDSRPRSRDLVVQVMGEA